MLCGKINPEIQNSNLNIFINEQLKSVEKNVIPANKYMTPVTSIALICR